MLIFPVKTEIITHFSKDYRNHRQEIISKLVNLMEEVCVAHLEKVSRNISMWILCFYFNVFYRLVLLLLFTKRIIHLSQKMIITIRASLIFVLDTSFFLAMPYAIYLSACLPCGRFTIRVRLDALTECSLTVHPAANGYLVATLKR